MLRRIININEDLCNGCGLCVDACHEQAIALRNNKAVLTRDDYCDGLGDCLPNCPTGAITFIEKDTLPYDDAAVKANLARKAAEKVQHISPMVNMMHEEACECPGSMMKVMQRPKNPSHSVGDRDSELTTWPIQLQLVSPNAAFFANADILIAADCTAFSYPNFQQDFMKNRVVLIACPKLDEADYIEKLTQIFISHHIRSITVVRMEVPCCGGLVNIVKQSLIRASVTIPLSIAVISTDGKIH